MTAGLRHADYVALVGKQVTLRPVESVESVESVEGIPATVSTCSEPVVSGDFVTYSVTFVAGPEAPRTQGAFLIDTAVRGPDPVFLVPLRLRGDGVEYEAVFNQSVQNGSGS
jgi:hypothetical protein